LPKQPEKEVAPPERPQTPDRGAVAREDVQPQKVKIPKPPIAVREPVRDKELTPPPKPEQPKPDPDVKAKPSKADTPDRSKDNDRSDKDKSESTK
jgi:hypothetical protein